MVWYSESGVQPNTIVRFDPRRQVFARAAIPSGGGVVRNMAATPDGRLFIACSGKNKVGVVAQAVMPRQAVDSTRRAGERAPRRKVGGRFAFHTGVLLARRRRDTYAMAASTFA
jgi:hypothetical protein